MTPSQTEGPGRFPKNGEAHGARPKDGRRPCDFSYQMRSPLLNLKKNKTHVNSVANTSIQTESNII